MQNSRLLLCAVTSAAVSICGSVASQDLVHTFVNPNFGGNPFVGTYLFGVADAQRTATVGDLGSGDGQGQIPGIGGDNIGGPTIVIPIGDLGPDDFTVEGQQ